MTAAFGSAKRNVDDGALPGHPAGQGAHFIERDIRGIADAAFAGSAGDGVLHAVAGKDLDSAVIHGDGNMDDDLAVGKRRTFHRPSSRLSLRAAKSKRALCASQGLISCSNEIAGLPDDINISVLIPRSASSSDIARYGLAGLPSLVHCGLGSLEPR